MTLMGTIQHGRIVLPAPLELPDGTNVEVDLRPLRAGFWDNALLSELAQQQQVIAPQALADLAGDWPDTGSIDEFLAAICHAPGFRP